MNFELLIATRYLKSKKKYALISLVSIISIIGIAVGVSALIISLGLMTGFQEDIQHKILGATAHILIYPAESNLLYDWEEIIKKIEKNKGIISTMPVIYEKGLISGFASTEGVVIKGIDVSSELKNKSNNLENSMIIGNLKDLLKETGRPKIILGESLAASIGAFKGDIVSFITIKGTLSPFGILPKMRKLEVAGIFRYGMYEYDSSWAYVSLKTAQHLFNLDDGINLIEVRIKDIYKVNEMSSQIKSLLGHNIITDTWINQNKSLFSAMKLEKIMLFITLALIIIVAAFNIISNLILMIMEKNKDIAILISMGATKNRITKIFVFQGLIIGIIGTTIGSIIGLSICYFFDKYKIIHLPADVYFISYLPFKIHLLDFLLVIVVALTITFLSTIYPSKKAAEFSPAETLRYG